MDTIKAINYVLLVFFFICYAYQAVYILIPFIVKKKPHKPAVMHRFAVLISARNEEAVIAKLLDSIKRQSYPRSSSTSSSAPTTAPTIPPPSRRSTARRS